MINEEAAVFFAFIYKKNIKYFSSISSRGCGFVDKLEKAL